MKKLFQIVLILASLSGASLTVFAQTNEQIETKIVGHLNNLEKFSYRGGTGDFDALERENRLLKAEILKSGKRSATIKYDFPALTEKMFITTSKDRELRIFSWDNQVGGSGRVFETVYQYKDKSGKVRTSSSSASGEGVVCASFVYQIFQLDTGKGRLYLASATAACSNALAVQDISLLRIDGVKLNKTLKLIKTTKGLTNSIMFEYDFFSVVDRKERPIKLFFYDETKKSFRFPVVVDDPKFTNGGKVTDRFISYGWDGKYFRKIK